jgi:hypothetical protein
MHIELLVCVSCSSQLALVQAQLCALGVVFARCPPAQVSDARVRDPV